MQEFHNTLGNNSKDIETATILLVDRVAAVIVVKHTKVSDFGTSERSSNVGNSSIAGKKK